jgi:hypothetical protein
MGLIVRDEDLPHSLRINLGAYCGYNSGASVEEFDTKLNQELAKFNAVQSETLEAFVFESEQYYNWFLIRWT